MDGELTIEAVRRAQAAPRAVTADRWLLVALLLGPILAVLGVTSSGLLDAADGLRGRIETGPDCAPLCAPDRPAR